MDNSPKPSADDVPLADMPKRAETEPLWASIKTRSLVRFLLFFAAGWAGVTLLQYFQTIIFTFTIAAILAFLLNYPVQYLKQFIGRGFALGVVIITSLLVILSLASALLITVVNQVQRLIESIQFAVSADQNLLGTVEGWLGRLNIQIDLQTIGRIVENALNFSINFVSGSLAALPNTFFTVIIILVVTFFMLIDGESLWHFGLRLVPDDNRDRFALAMKTSFLGFFQGQLLLCLFLSLSTLVLFSILKIPFALPLAIIVGILDTIPGIGATLGVIVISLISLVQGGWLNALTVVAVSVALQQIQDNLIAPRVMQHTVNLNPVVVFFALMVGARIAGLLGIFLSVPIAGTIVSLLAIEAMQARKD
ncbi:AI-2E family transporter [Trichothermofontia sp.]